MVDLARVYQNAENIKARRLQNRTGQLQLQEAMKGIERRESLEELFAKQQKPTAQEVMAIDPEAGFDYQKFLNEQDEAGRTLATERAGAIGRAALIADTPEKWDMAVDQLSQQYPDLARYKGRYSPEVQESAIAASNEVGEYLKGMRGTSRQRDMVAAGFEPGTPEYEQAMREAINKPQTVVNMANKGNEQIGRKLADQFTALMDQGLATSEQEARIARFEQLMQEVNTGAIESATLGFRRLAEGLGFDGNVEELGAQEAMKQIGTLFALQMVQQTKGAISNAEMALFVESAPSLSRTKRGNEMMLQFMRKINSYVAEKSDAANDIYLESGEWGPAEVKKLRRWQKANPIFSDADRRRVELLEEAERRNTE